MFSGESQGANWKTVKEASKILGISQRTIERKIRKAEIPTYSSPSGRRFVWITELQQKESDLNICLEKITEAIEGLQRGQQAIIENMKVEVPNDL